VLYPFKQRPRGMNFSMIRSGEFLWAGMKDLRKLDELHMASFLQKLLSRREGREGCKGLAKGAMWYYPAADE
jgi:hypothetical protein